MKRNKLRTNCRLKTHYKKRHHFPGFDSLFLSATLTPSAELSKQVKVKVRLFETFPAAITLKKQRSVAQEKRRPIPNAEFGIGGGLVGGGLLVRTFFGGLQKGFIKISVLMLFHVKGPL